LSVANCMLEGNSCLVHCSQGWDQTSQIVELAQILLDPYFRTIEGFMVLIEKEWVQFGHQFYVRLGHGIKNNKEKERCPIFFAVLGLCVSVAVAISGIFRVYLPAFG